jgi:hypothetical protein
MVILRGMTIYEYEVVYPDGDRQEIPHRLSIGQIVDLNGYPLRIPLDSVRTIAYRVIKIIHHEERGECRIKHYLELVPVHELFEFVSIDS